MKDINCFVYRAVSLQEHEFAEVVRERFKGYNFAGQTSVELHREVADCIALD